jgi:hypothetical protein
MLDLSVHASGVQVLFYTSLLQTLRFECRSKPSQSFALHSQPLNTYIFSAYNMFEKSVQVQVEQTSQVLNTCCMH